MIRALIVILAIAGTAFYFTDIESDSVITSVLLPILLVLALIALALWLVMLFQRRGISQRVDRVGNSVDTFGDGPGGDAG